MPRLIEGMTSTGTNQYLTATHALVQRITDIRSESDLRHHLIVWHNVKVTGKSKADLGRMHLIVHAFLSHPGMAEALGFPEGYGKP